MKYTNEFGLPDVYVRAVTDDRYSKGNSDFSVTGLLKPPRQAALQERYNDEIVVDVSTLNHIARGKGWHRVFEEYTNENEIAEKRFFADFKVNGRNYIISAQIDTLCLKSFALTDFKSTSSYKFKWDKCTDTTEWTAQLNMQLELLRRNNLDAKSLQIMAGLHDWSINKSREEDDYPKLSVYLVPIEMWPREKTTSFIETRILEHVLAKTSLPECSKDERWADVTKWALMVKGRKKANKLFTEKAACELALDYVKDSYMEERKGESKRCKNYCNVSKFCNQYQNILKGE